jgi:hypothetical protein
MVTRAHPGRSSLGCLTMLLVLVAVAYFGFNIGQAWSDYYALRDSMAQQARFGGRLTDGEIRRALVAKVDSLGLPEEAADFQIRRGSGRIVIWTEYVQLVELPLFVREFTFTPQVEAPL